MEEASLLPHVAHGRGAVCRMMSTESANSFTLIGEASDGGTMENLSRRLKASRPHSSFKQWAWLVEGVSGPVVWGKPYPDSLTFLGHWGPF